MARDDDRATSSEQTDEEKRQPRPDDPCACGSERLASGRCKETGLWPLYVFRKERRKDQSGWEVFSLAMKCPFACPICAQPLEWDGGCMQCYGSATPHDRSTWTFPGDRYERREVVLVDGKPSLDGHWEKVDGPRKACTPAENMSGFATVKAILAAGEQRRIGRAGMVQVDPAVRAEVDRRAR